MKPSPYTDRYSQRQIDDYYGAGLWSTETFDDLLVRHAEANPDKVFVDRRDPVADVPPALRRRPATGRRSASAGLAGR